MKRLAICFALVFLTIVSFAQVADVDNIVIKEGGYIHLTEVVQAPNVSKDNLYSNCIIWISESINSPKTAIQTENQQAGLITIKSAIPADDKGRWLWEFKLTIQMKEGRYKYDFTNISYCASAQTKYEYLSEVGYEWKDTPMEQYNWKNSIFWKNEAYRVFASTISSLKRKMATNNDW